MPQITAFLFDKGGHEDPKQLTANAGKSFVGSYVLGMGFTFDDSGEADDDTPGIPSPIATMERLIAENPKNAEVIFPYIGGKEVNDSPTHAHHRYVINFGDRSEEECRRQWPELMAIVERKVKPDRMTNNRESYRRYWWQYGEKRGELMSALLECKQVLTIPCVSNTLAFAPLGTRIVFSHKLIVFPLQEQMWFALMQSRIHECWARFFASSMKDDLNYSPTDCFETFPLPVSLHDSASSDPILGAQRHNLEAIGERYHQFRAELMVAKNEGLTNTYNRFHDPAEISDGILELRSLHQQLDQAVLQSYGWEDIPTTCGFGLDYLDSDDDTTLPPALQVRIASGDLFFHAASEACAFQSQLRQYGVVNPPKSSPGATAGPMPSAMKCWPGCWRSMPSAMRRSRQGGCRARGRRRGLVGVPSGKGGMTKLLSGIRLAIIRASKWGWRYERLQLSSSDHPPGAVTVCSILAETAKPTLPTFQP